ncbi:Cysteine desulfurase, NifS [Syntrophomonas zehnderi OL-4]|uniref:cysteine desulfurase n=1 Tax=Syntrophomonas zehnderi OL-4 TaxID=690567 RepID=A0A0E3W3L7_9FIRM|nr:cysteine desulfurase family protein [Syntrophomonas zehnderi]CFX91686.1 Cysteine desulfurase, NifS [Syntrophomonas zehnderi OL-4]
MRKVIYLDHAATTPLNCDVLEKMKPYLCENFGNASSIYQLGIESRAAVDESRYKVAYALKCQAHEIFFTSCGTESNNWAIKGIAFANRLKGNHIITSAIEHPAVKNSCEYLEHNGFDITYLPVDEFGVVSLDILKKSIRKNTILISIMYANNEVGTMQPIKEIGQIARESNIYFHTDAVQAIGNIDIDVNDCKVDMLSLSAHKFNGPKGVGALYIRTGTNIDPYLHGGSQELNRRSGTENVPGIVGLGKAIELSTIDIESKNKKVLTIRNLFIGAVIRNIPNVFLNGHPTLRLPGNANFFFQGIDAKYLATILNDEGIYVSNGSACSCNSKSPSHVLLAMNKTEETALGSVRFTFGEENTEDEVNYVVDVLSKVIEYKRKNP